MTPPLRIAATLALLGGLMAATTGEATDHAALDFSRDVRPILADNCFECHGPDEESRGADLRLDQLDEAIGWAIQPGDAAGSLLMQRLRSHDEYEVMPPPESTRRPSETDIATLARWIDEGAHFEPHWAFVPPRRPNVPTVADADWPRNPIDAFAAAHLEATGQSPSPDAAPRLLARRLSLALTGLPVSPEEADAFAAAFGIDADAAIADFVDGRLASPAYGEHVAWSWLDAARYADTNGYQADGYRIMWPWRDWLIGQLNANQPFDEMTRHMLAGDLLAPPASRDWQSADWLPDEHASDLHVATGFLRNHRYDTGSGTIPAESRFENAADRMETVGTVWMGMTMLCARCHTHKYDPIDHAEYYQLLSFFDNVPEVGMSMRGASHPFLRTPGGAERDRIASLAAAAEKAHAAVREVQPLIATAQAAWEETLSKTSDAAGTFDGVGQTKPRVRRGLRHRFAVPPIRLDGRTAIRKTNKPLTLITGDRPWTVSFAVKPSADRNGAIFSAVEKPDSHRVGLQADWVDGRIRVRHVCKWVGSYIEFESARQLEPGVWHHVTLSSDGRRQGLAYRATLDGDESAMRQTHGVTGDGINKASKASLVLGDSPLMPKFMGRLADLRFYDRCLDENEIASLADPRTLGQVAAIAPAARTAAEAATLRLAFLESDGLPKPVADRIDAARAAAAARDAAIKAAPTVMVMQEANTPPTRVRLAGVFDSLGPAVPTGTPSFLPPLGEGPADRRSLAEWLVDPGHPLTARVTVNRLWQTLWGTGFVDSPENFGTQCAEPLQADLLDWLATEYIRLGWDTKALVRLIVTSRAYRQSSAATAAQWEADPLNRQLARGPRFRLPVHTVRDQALALSGTLDRTLGGPPVLIDEPLGKDGRPLTVPFEMARDRRTIYAFWQRNAPHPMLAVFDVADRNRCEVRVNRTNTPLQALVTLNEPGLADCAAKLGQRVRQRSEDIDNQLAWVWMACTGRRPDATETSQLVAMLDAYREQTLTEGGDATDADATAWTALCNVLLNLDATLTLE